MRVVLLLKRQGCLKLKRLISSLALLIITGCSSPTVFLTTERLPEKNKQELVSALSENGFTVKTTSGVRVPKEFPDVVVATNPANENLEFFDKLERVIRQQSYSPITYQKFYQQIPLTCLPFRQYQPQKHERTIKMTEIK